MFKIFKAFLLTGGFFLIFLAMNISLFISRPHFWMGTLAFGWSYSFYIALFTACLFSALSALCTYKILGKFNKFSLLIPLSFIIMICAPIFIKFSMEIEIYASALTLLSLSFLTEWFVFRWLEKKEALKTQKRP